MKRGKSFIERDREMSEEESEIPLWARLVAAGSIVAGFIVIAVWILARWYAGLEV